MKRALVTGASGFIGSAMVGHLRRTGYDVIALTRGEQDRSDGQSIVLSRWPDEKGFAEILRRNRPDIVFHLAGATIGTADYLHQINVSYAESLLRAASRVDKPPQIVLAGSAAEYGLIAVDTPVNEELECRPQTDYARSKLRQTELGLAAAARGLPVVLPRLFNVIGANMRSHLSIGRFVDLIAGLGPNGGALETGPLHAERDFVSVHDAVRIMEALCRLEGANGRVVNVCSGQSVSIETLLRLLVKTAARPVDIVVNPSRQGVSAIDRIVGSTSRLASFDLVPPMPDFPVLFTEMLLARGVSNPSIAGLALAPGG